MKTLTMFLIFTLITFHSSSVNAETRAFSKLGRGVFNVATAPIEIVKQARQSWIEGAQVTDHILIWIGTGAVWGIVQTIKRSASGVWDVVSFPFDIPLEGEPILKPNTVFEDWPRDPTVFIFKKDPE